MRARSLSAVAIVVVGLLPTLVGGPLFALLMSAIGVLAMREYLGLATRLPASDAPPNTGYAVIGGLALAALSGVAGKFQLWVDLTNWHAASVDSSPPMKFSMSL